MKKTFLIFICLSTLVPGLSAQTLQDAKNLIYFEKLKSAQKTLYSIVEREGGNGEALYLLTRCSPDLKETEFIESEIVAMPDDLKRSPFIECAQGNLCQMRGAIGDALAHFKGALQQTKQKDPAILYAVALANIESDSGNAVIAVDLLGRAIKIDKSNAAFYVALGNAYRRLMNGTESYKAYNKALSIDPVNAAALYRLGKLFQAQNNQEMYLKYFSKATEASPSYGPAWYALYCHYYFKNPEQAINCLNHFVASSDIDPENNYRLTDLLYLSKKYNEAIKNAMDLLHDKNSPEHVRLYKLIAYSYDELQDYAKALIYMRKYLHEGADTSFSLMDFETMGRIYSQFPEKIDSAALYYAKASDIEKDNGRKIEFYQKISELLRKSKDYNGQAIWLGRFYEANSNATNLDLFNWGLAHYMAGNYNTADSVFSRYISKYPEQTFGYYWRARSNAAIDTSMEFGLAIPYYEALINIMLKDSAGHINKKWMIEAYGYLAAYHANSKKEYDLSIDYFEKILALDPDNASAKKYVSILRKNISNKETKASK